MILVFLPSQLDLCDTHFKIKLRNRPRHGPPVSSLIHVETLPSTPSSPDMMFSKTARCKRCQVLLQFYPTGREWGTGAEGQNVGVQMAGLAVRLFPIRSERGNKSPRLFCKTAVQACTRRGDINSPFRHPHFNYHI